MDLHRFSDIHTHRLDAGPDAVINLPLMAEVPAQGSYSVGIHPWDTATLAGDDLDSAIEWLRRAAAEPNVVAIGEAGLDAMRGADAPMQEALFLRQAQLSEELGKPMIIHTVRTLPRLMHLRKTLKPRQPWIIHGYRGNAVTARQLLRLGFEISLGRKYNPEVLEAVPAQHLYRETDDFSE